uniref:protein unc-93 homolog A-like n=1 Tax=Styela clava TaxID=7725 RepID=UPI001939E97F|nr:protein unc-93 homolog A-like [Styela clava]
MDLSPADEMTPLGNDGNPQEYKEENITYNRKHKKHGTRKTAKQFWIFNICFLLAFAPYLSILGLQSSINIEEGIGTLSLGVAYASSIIFALFITPIAVRRLGSHRAIVIGELGYLIYILANFYPKSYIMIIAGAIVGCGEALVWTTLPMYFWHFGYQHGEFGTKPFESYVLKYTGLFYTVFQLGQIFGSSVSYGVLYGFKNKTQEISSYNSSSDLLHENETEMNLKSHLQYQYCGANDCQSPNVTSENIDSYVPADPYSLYIVISIFCAISLSGICLHFKFLPRAKSKPLEIESNDQNVLHQKKDTDDSSEIIIQNTNFSYVSTLRQTCKHFFNPKQLLVSPILFYIGIFIAFIYSEMSRAYISCVLGVEQMGAVLIVYAFVSGCISALSPRIISKFGRNIVMSIACLIDMSNFIFCLLWKPQDDTKYLVYLVGVMCGLSDGTWRNCTMDFYTEYFLHNQEISFTIWNFWITLGIAVAFFWSPYLCVSVKLYIQIGLLIFGIMCYVGAEYIHYKEKKLVEKRRLFNE